MSNPSPLMGALMPGYYAAWIAATMACLGALALQVIAESTSASWMVPLRRPAEALSGGLPLCALLFAPVVIFANAIFPWARELSSLPPEVAKAVAHKAGYLAVKPFLLRSALYLLSWIAIAELLRRWSLAQDESASPTEIERLSARRRTLSGASLPWLLFSGTFATFDWIMSLEPAWKSTAYGAIFLAGCGAAATAIVCITSVLREEDPRVRPAHLHAIGNFLLAAVMFWAYVGFSQILIHWIGDMPEDVPWYLRRVHGGWKWVSIALGVLHFAVPFVLLLMRRLKRTRALAWIAAVVVVGHLLDAVILVLPAQPALHAIAFVPAVVVLALVGVFCVFRYRRALPVPPHDPLLGEAMRFEMPS